MKLRNVILAILLPIIPFMAMAGEASLAWDPVDTAVSYNVYYGGLPGVYDESINTTNEFATLTAPDCVDTHYAIKALDNEGLESLGYSNEVFGFPKPTLTSITPSVVDAPFNGDIVVTGLNFDDFVQFAFTNGTIQINSVTRDACDQLTVNISVPANEPGGDKGSEVINKDNVWSGNVPGLFSVNNTSATEPPPTPVNVRRTEK